MASIKCKCTSSTRPKDDASPASGYLHSYQKQAHYFCSPITSRQDGPQLTRVSGAMRFFLRCPGCLHSRRPTRNRRRASVLHLNDSDAQYNEDRLSLSWVFALKPRWRSWRSTSVLPRNLATGNGILPSLLFFMFTFEFAHVLVLTLRDNDGHLRIPAQPRS